MILKSHFVAGKPQALASVLVVVLSIANKIQLENHHHHHQRFNLQIVAKCELISSDFYAYPRFEISRTQQEKKQSIEMKSKVN